MPGNTRERQGMSGNKRERLGIGHLKPVPPTVAPMSFIVRDDAGNVWPPGFKPRLTDPLDPLCMIPQAAQRARAANLKLAIVATAESDGGWGTGHIPGIGTLPAHIKLLPKPSAMPAARHRNASQERKRAVRRVRKT